ncbi:MAG TPA: patatin-like phospholipase family protein [Thiobacillaceae bacterium]|nr:patatin-like phospholipase family protein [Thiobacillaceae bacterium]HNU63336.1 patatin-like phospholipase family protein [Thiobacillaceae bacterium]
MGLAFSGGGIRSATFNLGILQGMARRGLLKHVDYLSTVSGGGYIGAWYMAFLKRQAQNQPIQAEDMLDPEGPRRPGEPVEHPSITWLRRFSNYLTPRTGLSGDSLTLVSTYLRNLLLNLIVILSFLGVLLLVPRALAWSVPYLWYLEILPFLATLPLVFAVLSLPVLLLNMHQGTRAAEPWWKSQAGVLLLVVLPAMLAAFFLSLSLASPAFGPWTAHAARILTRHMPFLGSRMLDDSLLITQFIATLIYLVPWILAAVWIWFRRRDIPRAAAPALVLSALGTSIAAGLMFFGLAHLAALTFPTPFELVIFGPPLVLTAFMLPVALHIGLARRRFSDMQREWWARLGGWLLTLMLAWLLLFGLAFFGAPLLGLLNDWVATSGGLAWAATTLWGVLAGKSANRNTPGKGLRETLLGLAPWVFLLGLLLLLSLAMQKGLEAPWEDAPGRGTSTVAHTMPGKGLEAWRAAIAPQHGAVSLESVAGAGSVLLTLFALFGWRIDINLFSLHNFYRNRLTRCYLGASRHCGELDRGWPGCRKPDAFTGFDPDDDLAVSELGPRPYPLFNTALNLVGGEELAWQQRKAASFCITPRSSGYQFPPGMADAQIQPTYGPSDIFMSGESRSGGIRVGTAMAISGAAVNPSMGFHSSREVSFLLTVFNVRLGRWVGNPAHAATWRKTSPGFGVRYLFLELFGMTSARRPWLNLSDGGHFENLGLYELVRRRLPYIIVSDAAEDADYHFDDLANAIRKVRADFGIDIEIDVSGMRPSEPGGRQRTCATVGSIRYDRLDHGLRPGVLVYIRPGLTGDEPVDVLGYASLHPSFPFQSTTDQFFDESQFESYRQLGLHIAKKVFAEAAQRQPTRRGFFNVEAFFTVLKESWRGRLAVDPDSAQRLHIRLDDLFERLRKDPDLAFLSAEIFPEWPNLMGRPPTPPQLPPFEAQRRAGFYVCREIAQFMERAYLDLNLEEHHDHPDSRAWMNLFRHWSWSPMFRVTYAITASTLSERFQRFCGRHLDLRLGDAEICLSTLSEAALNRLNFLERDLVKRLLATAPDREGASGHDLVRFELVVANPIDHAKAAHFALLHFHFGFALLEDRQLVYFRVQDHLRRMGLARQAMSLLLAREPDLVMDLEACTRRLRGVDVPQSESRVLYQLYQSVQHIQHSRDPLPSRASSTGGRHGDT